MYCTDFMILCQKKIQLPSSTQAPFKRCHLSLPGTEERATATISGADPTWFLKRSLRARGSYRSDNVVGRLFEGDIAIGIQEQDQWLLHEAGGWSIRFHGEFEWLKLLDGDG